MVTAYDASLAAQLAEDANLTLPGVPGGYRGRADVSGDGFITAFDAALIAQRAVGLISRFPVEG